MALRNPELQRLLESLKNASSNPAPQGNNNPADISLQNLTDHRTNSRGDPASSSSRDASDQVQKLSIHRGLLPGEASSRSATPTPSVVADASTIVTWPNAVKHVTNHIVNDDKVCTRIRHLITEQRKHEQQWWAQREAIVARHNGRADSNAKVAELLKDLGGLAAPIKSVDKAAEKNELDAFDKKVYKSLVQMSADFDGQLRKLGIPFFAIKHELVSVGNRAEEDLPRKSRLDKGELRELQKRMLQYLEDLLMDG